MVMALDRMDSSSESDSERHDRFRSERVFGEGVRRPGSLSSGGGHSRRARSPRSPRRHSSPARKRSRNFERSSRDREGHHERKHKHRREERHRRSTPEHRRSDHKKSGSEHSDESKHTRASSLERSKHGGRHEREKKSETKPSERKRVKSSESKDTKVTTTTSSVVDVNINNKKVEKNFFGPALPPKEPEAVKEETVKMVAPQAPKQNVEINKNGASPLTQSEEEEDLVDTYGPRLPNVETNSSAYGPSLPETEKKCYGPTLPTPTEGATQEDTTTLAPSLPLQKEKEDIKEEGEPKKRIFGPSLPRVEEDEEDRYGPALPPKLQVSTTAGEEATRAAAEDATRPAAVEDGELLEDDDGESFGPLAPGAQPTNNHLALQLRASHIKKQWENKESEEVKGREEWMTALPEKKSCLDGLKQRQFRPSAAPQQDLSWTHTPEQKLQALKDGPAEVSLEEEARLAALKARDSEMEKLAKKAKKSKKRDEKSLLELHQKELKKKKKKEKKEREGKKEERRPFNRDIDLQANRLDDAQKKAIYKKAQLLDSRFSFGESKFL